MKSVKQDEQGEWYKLDLDHTHERVTPLEGVLLDEQLKDSCDT